MRAACLLVPGMLVMVACGQRQEAPPPTVPAVLPSAFTRPTVSGSVQTAWLNDFADPRLTALVEEAWRANPDLQATAARLQQARARASQAGAARLPSLSLAAGAGRSRAQVMGQTAYANTYELGLTLSWEADVWGRLAAAAKAEANTALAAEADLIAAQQSLAAQVAKAWFLVTHDRLQLRLSEEFQASAVTTADLVAKRFADGRSPAVDVRAARAQAARAAVDVAGRRKALQRSQRDLELLLGRYPAAEVAGADDLPPVPAPVPAGLPAELLLRRPDLQAAVARLRAADERLASAEADLLPRISLTASGGTRSDDIADVFSSESLIGNLVANLLAPIFDGGRRRAVVDERQAQLREVVAVYAKQALQALREVELALALGEEIRGELDHQRRAVDETHQVVRELRQRYGQGLTDGVILLSEERQALGRDKELLALRLEALLNRIDLHLALGGTAAEEQDAVIDTLLAEDAS